MKIRDVMHSPVLSLPFDTSYEDAARFLFENDITGAPVTNDAGDVIGIISEKDLYRVLYPYYRSFYETPELYTDFESREAKVDEIKRNPIERFMTREVVTARPEDPIMKVGGIMIARGIHRMPVLDEAGTMIGIVTRRDIYRTIIKARLGM